MERDNFLNRVAGRLGYAPQKRHNDSAARLTAILGGIDGEDANRAGREPYKHNVTVYRCVNLLASSVGRLPLRLYRGEEAVDTHPLLDLLDAPNPLMDRAKLMRTIVSHECVYGAAYLVLDEKNSKGLPIGLYPLPPEHVSPLHGNGGLYDLKGWQYGAGKTSKTYQVDEIARFEYAVAPDNPLRAVSPIEVARLTVESDYLAAIYNKSVLKNSGTPAGVLKYAGDGRMSEEDARHVKAQWMQAYGGVQNAESVAVLSGNFDFDSIGSASKDLQWLEGREWSQGEIAAVFNVPPLFVGQTETSGISDAGLRVQERMLYTGAVIPLARAIEAVLNRRLTGPIDQSLTLRFDLSDVEALREDMASRLAQAKDLAALGVPVNQINRRLELGLDDQDWGDQGLLPAGLTTPEALIEGASLPFDLSGIASARPSIEVQSRSVRDPIKVPEFIQANAKRGLDYHADGKSGDGIRPHTIREANDMAAGTVTEDKLRRMSAWFARHESDLKPSKNSDPDDPKYPGAGAVGWLLWGGNPTSKPMRAKEWCDRKIASIDDDGRSFSSEEKLPVSGLVEFEVEPMETSVEAAARTREARVHYWKRSMVKFDRIESKMIAKLRRSLMKQRAKVLKALSQLEDEQRSFSRAPKDTELSLAALQFSEEELAAAMRSATIDSSAEGVLQMLKSLRSLGVISDEVYEEKVKLIPQLAEQYYDARLGLQVEIGERMKVAVNQTLLEGWANGENLSDLKDRVRKTFNGLASVSRARTIARTEIHIAQNSGRFRAAREQAVDEFEWLSSGDSEVRDGQYTHRIDGERRELGQPFPTGGGIRHPGDPSGPAGDVINCRCTVLPVYRNRTEVSE